MRTNGKHLESVKQVDSKMHSPSTDGGILISEIHSLIASPPLT